MSRFFGYNVGKREQATFHFETNLAQKFSACSEVKAKGFWVIVKDVFHGVIELCVHSFHVTKDYLTTKDDLVEWPNEES